jgi:hypothetical protein
MLLIGFSTRIYLRGTQLRQSFVKFTSCPIKPIKHLLVFLMSRLDSYEILWIGAITEPKLRVFDAAEKSCGESFQ